MTDAFIYKIESADVWSAAEKAGRYDGSDVDCADGFIHFSTARQAGATLSKWFHGRKRLVIAAIDTASLGAALRYEPARGGELFPHLYAPLAMTAVRWTRPIADRPDGGHDLGSLDP